jgi:hypothetical protein
MAVISRANEQKLDSTADPRASNPTAMQIGRRRISRSHKISERSENARNFGSVRIQYSVVDLAVVEGACYALP